MASIVEHIVRIVTDGEETKAEVVGELVRCRDCKWFNDYEVECSLSTGLIYATSNDYCSRGERKEAEKIELCVR